MYFNIYPIPIGTITFLTFKIRLHVKLSGSFGKLQKFCPVLHQANTLDDITEQQQVTSNMVTNPSGCIYKVTEKVVVVVGQLGGFFF